jgi:hypothetical protein
MIPQLLVVSIAMVFPFGACRMTSPSALMPLYFSTRPEIPATRTPLSYLSGMISLCPSFLMPSLSAFLILISTLLSLRTKDEVTAEATERLFALAGTPADMLLLPEREIARAIYPVGFYHTKAKTILHVCRCLMDQYQGQVPADLDTLLTIKGVGRKTANLVMTLDWTQRKARKEAEAEPGVMDAVLLRLLPLIGAAVSGFLGPCLLRKRAHWPIWLSVGASAFLSVWLTVIVIGFADVPGAASVIAKSC